MKVEKFCLVGLVLLLSMFTVSVYGTTVRWDIVRFEGGALVAGGDAGAVANDTSEIVFTGSGTAVLEEKEQVTGGGDWYIVDPNGDIVGKGTYDVTELVYFAEAPGTFPGAIRDGIGMPADARAGLMVLHIAYSDGKEGLLTVSCRLMGSPSHVFEGITAITGNMNFFAFEPGSTLFHIVR